MTAAITQLPVPTASIKSEKITAFGGIFFVLDKFDSILSSVIDSHLGLRSTLIGYQYSEIIRAIFSVFCCGGDCMEDLNLYLKDMLTERPHTRVPSADTVLRGIEELATENISYTVEKTGNVYDFYLRILGNSNQCLTNSNQTSIFYTKIDYIFYTTFSG